MRQGEEPLGRLGTQGPDQSCRSSPWWWGEVRTPSRLLLAWSTDPMSPCCSAVPTLGSLALGSKSVRNRQNVASLGAPCTPKLPACTPCTAPPPGCSQQSALPPHPTLGPTRPSPSWSWAWGPGPRHPGSFLPAPSAWRGCGNPSRWTVAMTSARAASAHTASPAASRPAAPSAGKSASRSGASGVWGRR